MNLQETISNSIITLLPFLALLCAYIFKIISSRMPQNILATLQQFTPIVVHSIEQTYSNVPGAQKKEIASTTISELFRDLKLPPPSQEAISNAIESTVLLMNQLPQIAAAKENHNPLENQPKSIP